MGAFTDFRRWATSPSSCDRSRSSKTRSRPATSHSGCCEDAHRNKRARKQPSFPLGWSGIADISETNFELPPPSPLRRAVQGPHRSSTSKSCERSRVWDETVLVSEMALEEEWTMKPRCYETASDFEGLENFKRRVASLQTKFSYTSLQGEGVSIDSGHPSSTSIVVDEREKEREREGKIESEEPSRNAQPQYKRLHQKAREIDFKLTTLEMEIELATAKLEALQFTKLKDKAQDDHDGSHSEEKLVSLRDALAPLKEDEESLIARVLKGRNRHEVLVMHESSNIEITGQILQCLMPGAWLNDEVINLYFELLKEREKREPKKFLKCHFFNTFFYKKLYNKTNYDYKAVRRWTTQRKIGYTLTDCDKIFVPIHKEIHWCLAIIDIRAKKFQYLDSLKGSDLHVLQVLVRYIVDEAKDKTGQDLDVSTWEQEFVRELPAQENGSDCGVFMIKYADFHSQGLPLSFSQTNMPYFRKRTAKEILGLRAE